MSTATLSQQHRTLGEANRAAAAAMKTNALKVYAELIGRGLNPEDGDVATLAKVTDQLGIDAGQVDADVEAVRKYRAAESRRVTAADLATAQKESDATTAKAKAAALERWKHHGHGNADGNYIHTHVDEQEALNAVRARHAMEMAELRNWWAVDRWQRLDKVNTEINTEQTKIRRANPMAFGEWPAAPTPETPPAPIVWHHLDQKPEPRPELIPVAPGTSVTLDR